MEEGWRQDGGPPTVPVLQPPPVRRLKAQAAPPAPAAAAAAADEDSHTGTRSKKLSKRRGKKKKKAAVEPPVAIPSPLPVPVPVPEAAADEPGGLPRPRAYSAVLTSERGKTARRVASGGQPRAAGQTATAATAVSSLLASPGPASAPRSRVTSNMRVATTVSPLPPRASANPQVSQPSPPIPSIGTGTTGSNSGNSPASAQVVMRTSAGVGAAGRERPRSTLLAGSLSGGAATLSRGGGGLAVADTDAGGEARPGRVLDTQPFMYRSASVPRSALGTPGTGTAAPANAPPPSVSVEPPTPTATTSSAPTAGAAGGAVARRKSFAQKRRAEGAAAAAAMRARQASATSNASASSVTAPHAATAPATTATVIPEASGQTQAAAAAAATAPGGVVIGPITIVTSTGHVTARVSLDSQRSHSSGKSHPAAAQQQQQQAGAGTDRTPKREQGWTHRLRRFFLRQAP
jgi:hypothetical protein